MIYNDFCGEKVSRLGFGMMRLPQLPNGEIDEKTAETMVESALAGGVNYFDTAYPYLGGKSEIVTGKLLGRHPRESFYLATKYPGHQISEHHDPRAVFEEQLKKCGVEYFDFYLLHNVFENSIATYTDERFGIIEYFREQRALGRIRHLGFSTHAQPEFLAEFLDNVGSDMEFCQLQLNYLDWTLQRADEKYKILCERGIPAIVMEPLRGGKLAALPKALRESEREAIADTVSDAELGFRFVQALDNVKVTLSGMSAPTQVEENLRTFAEKKPLAPASEAALFRMAEKMKEAVPCTRCRYCCAGCPAGLDIPSLLHLYNDAKYAASVTVGMALDAIPPEKLPSACLSCGACRAVCPQKINIPEVLKDFSALLPSIPSWAAICREREADAARNRRA